MNSALKRFYITQVKYPQFELPHHLRQPYLSEFPLLPICIFHDHEFLIYFIQYDDHHILLFGEHLNKLYHHFLPTKDFKRFLYYPQEFYSTYPYLQHIHSHFMKYDYPVWDIIHDWLHDNLMEQHISLECIFISFKWNMKSWFSEDNS